MRRELFAHLLTSLGALCAMAALLAVFDQSWDYVYGWLALGIAAQVIGADNALMLADADAVEPSERPDGAPSARPADAVSFLLSVFVPVLAMLHAGFLDGPGGVVVAGLIMLAAIYRLAYLTPATAAFEGPPDRFTGLPSVWSVIGFYLHAFDATPLASVLAVGLALVLSLVPFLWPNPLYSARWRVLTRTVLALWAGTSAFTLLHGFPATPLAKTLLLVCALYGVMLTVMLNRQEAEVGT